MIKTFTLLLFKEVSFQSKHLFDKLFLHFISADKKEKKILADVISLAVSLSMNVLVVVMQCNDEATAYQRPCDYACACIDYNNVSADSVLRFKY